MTATNMNPGRDDVSIGLDRPRTPVSSLSPPTPVFAGSTLEESPIVGRSGWAYLSFSSLTTQSADARPETIVVTTLISQWNAARQKGSTRHIPHPDLLPD